MTHVTMIVIVTHKDYIILEIAIFELKKTLNQKDISRQTMSFERQLML